MQWFRRSLFVALVFSVAVVAQNFNLDTQVKGSRLPMWSVDSGTANAYVITTTAPLGPSLRTGSRFMFIATHANTTASTAAVDGGSAIAIKKNVSTALASGDIALNQVIEITYDGTNFQLVGPGAIPTAITQTIASGTSALGTSAISSASCASVVTTSATGTLTTDVVTASFNGDPTAVTGYVPLTTGMLVIFVYPTTDNVNFKVCNNTASSITPGAITLNWRVAR